MNTSSGRGIGGSQSAGIAFAVLAVAALVFGWRQSEFRYLTAAEGLGYALGIVGGSMMLALLLYPLRKRARFMRHVGSVRFWFRTHMVFGIVGPVLILYHANYGLGSLNSTLALVAMLAVAASGLVGRYFYTRIHQGLYGRRIALSEIIGVAAQEKGRIDQASQVFGLSQYVDHVARLTVAVPGSGVSRHIFAILRFDLGSAKLRRRIRKLKRASAKKQRFQQLESHLQAYLDASRRVLHLQLFERLFALWHVFHLPLFVMLVITGVVHVFAVHIY